MKVLKANEAQYKKLNGFENLPYRLSFIKDANDNWITDVNVLNCEAYNAVLDKLQQLEVIDYNPKPE